MIKSYQERVYWHVRKMVIDHDDAESGNAWWDMRSINNQEIAPGLYIFHVEETGKSSDPFIGKFAVIR